MKRVWIAPMAALAVLLATAPVPAQVAQIKQVGKKALEAGAKAQKDVSYTEDEERQIGADISARLRQRYGVVQDAAIHKYISTLGTLLAQSSDRPKIKWTFIVLDTDGINAFAAPGGFIHITRGALALIRNEAELAGVLGHEISHVVFKHTLMAIRTSKELASFGKVMTTVTRTDFLERSINKGYSLTLENAFSVPDEQAADAAGITLANGLNYAPQGLTAFLQRLDDRNKGMTDRSGLFASHPATKARLDEIASLIEEEGLASKAIVQARYARSVAYKPVAVSQMSQVPAPVETTAKAEPPKPEPKTGLDKFGLGGLKKLGKEKPADATIAATGSRGVNPDRDAKGGPNKALVVVTVSPAEIATFRKGIVG
ncbi:MAG TPA: M48 family metalloprotease [Vicinamibacterales bacterium]|nr:M48 family metalloprotease [Vicinamibacterales bacterium]